MRFVVVYELLITNGAKPRPEKPPSPPPERQLSLFTKEPTNRENEREVTMTEGALSNPTCDLRQSTSRK